MSSPKFTDPEIARTVRLLRHTRDGLTALVQVIENYQAAKRSTLHVVLGDTPEADTIECKLTPMLMITDEASARMASLFANAGDLAMEGMEECDADLVGLEVLSKDNQSIYTMLLHTLLNCEPDKLKERTAEVIAFIQGVAKAAMDAKLSIVPKRLSDSKLNKFSWRAHAG